MTRKICDRFDLYSSVLNGGRCFVSLLILGVEVAWPCLVLPAIETKRQVRTASPVVPAPFAMPPVHEPQFSIKDLVITAYGAVACQPTAAAIMTLYSNSSFRLAILCLLLSFVLVNPCFAENPSESQPNQANQTVKILLIGNSLSGNAATYLPAFARAGGKQVVLFLATVGGKSLQEHTDFLAAYEKNPADPIGHPYIKVEKKTNAEELRAYSLIEALESDKWDYVSLQQLSGLSYKPESFEPAAGKLIEVIHRHAPQAKILAYQTWPYRIDHPLYHTGEFTRQTMFEGIKTAYDGLASKYRLRLIPVGEAFMAAEQSRLWQFVPDVNFDFKNPPPDAMPLESGTLQRGWKRVGGKMVLDGKHANALGCYLDAAVWYEVLFEDDVRPIVPEVVPGIDPEKAADLRRIAHEIVTVSGLARIPDRPEAITLLEAPHSPATDAPDTTSRGVKPFAAGKPTPAVDE